MTQSLLVCLEGGSQVEDLASFVAAAHPGADVTLLHVIPYTEKRTAPSRGGRNRPDGWYADAREDAEDLFELATDRLGDTAERVETVIESGEPSQEILAVAEDRGVDQLVLGFRKRSPTGKLVFGSVAQDVLLSTSRPVVAVPLAES